MSENNQKFDPEENFQIELFDQHGGATIGNKKTATVTIKDDDGKIC